MSNTLYIRKSRLPVPTDEALEFIYDYFNEFEVDCIEFDDYYQINLRAVQYTYCENISSGLEFLGIEHEDIKSFCSMRNRVVLCLSKNWLPFAFSKFLSQTNENISELTILHVDDHRDLMSPYLSYQNGLYFDMISGNAVDFTDPLSVKRAVESGAITIGSMLTAIVYSLQRTDIFHIKENVRYKSSKLKKQCFPDNLQSDDYNRIAIKIDEAGCGIGEYHITSEWRDVIAHIDVSKPCLLHIDMDYFNNRYNASTSWMENKDRHDPPFEQQKILMDALFEGLKSIIKLTEVNQIEQDLLAIDLKNHKNDYGEKFVRQFVSAFALKSREDERLHYLGAYLNDKICDYCYYFDEANYKVLDGLTVNEESRHQYVAFSLISYIIAASDSVMYLHSDKDNTPKEMYRNMDLKILIFCMNMYVQN